MKVIICIGSSSYIAPDAASAAKVADIIGKFQPLSVKYAETIKSNRALVLECSFEHRIKIESSVEEKTMTPSEFKTWEEDCIAEEKK